MHKKTKCGGYTVAKKGRILTYIREPQGDAHSMRVVTYGTTSCISQELEIFKKCSIWLLEFAKGNIADHESNLRGISSQMTLV